MIKILLILGILLTFANDVSSNDEFYPISAGSDTIISSSNEKKGEVTDGSDQVYSDKEKILTESRSKIVPAYTRDWFWGDGEPLSPSDHLKMPKPLKPPDWIHKDNYRVRSHKKNKSARKKLPNYPYFVSDQGTGVYFDLPDEYGEEYDSSFYFTINQFRIDSLDKPQLPLFEFDGVFYSKNVFVPLNAKLITMPDKSLGFIKKLDEKGLPAYDNSITVFDTIQMDSRGLSGKGYINYLTSNLYYKKIRLFPDSAKAFIDKGFVIEGFDNNNIGPFPDMEITNMEMGYYFNQDQDSVYLNLIDEENYKKAAQS